MTDTQNQPTGWEIAAKKFGYQGQSPMEAGRSKHLIILPTWEPFCTCWRDIDKYRSPGPVLANEHVRCHQRDCDLHEGAISRWLVTQKQKKARRVQA